MTPRAIKAVADLRASAELLRSSAQGNALSLAVAAVLDAHASYWTAWFPSEPTHSDKAIAVLARAIQSSLQPKTPDADAGTRQHTTSPKEQ